MATVTAQANKISMSDLALNTAIEKVRLDRKAAKAAIKAPMAENDIPQDVKREIASVIGTNTASEVRFIAWETIEAHDVILDNGTVVHVGEEDIRVYSVVVPGTKLKRGYKTYVRIAQKIDGPKPMINFPSAMFLVVPAMWRRVAFLPNSRSCFGGISAYVQQWKKHKWDTRGSHASSVNDVYELEKFVR